MLHCVVLTLARFDVEAYFCLSVYSLAYDEVIFIPVVVDFWLSEQYRKTMISDVHTYMYMHCIPGCLLRYSGPSILGPTMGPRKCGLILQVVLK